MTEFYEDDELLEKIREIRSQPPDFITAAPDLTINPYTLIAAMKHHPTAFIDVIRMAIRIDPDTFITVIRRAARINGKQ